LLDRNTITIGEDGRIGPAAQIYTPDHPLGPAVRRSGLEAARPVAIGDNVRLDGGAIVCPGVTIGAGSVVVRDLSPGVVAVGNPCRVVRSLCG
jgi:maltose O-acetyltransferase